MQHGSVYMPFPLGVPANVLGRTLAKLMADRLCQAVVVVRDADIKLG
jgi:hypothetical protein